MAGDNEAKSIFNIVKNKQVTYKKKLIQENKCRGMLGVFSEEWSRKGIDYRDTSHFIIVRILFWLISEVEGSSLLDRDHWLETGLIKTDTRTTLNYF